MQERAAEEASISPTARLAKTMSPASRLPYAGGWEGTSPQAYAYTGVNPTALPRSPASAAWGDPDADSGQSDDGSGSPDGAGAVTKQRFHLGSNF